MTEQHQENTSHQNSFSLKDFFKKYFAHLLIFCFGFLLYAQTIKYEYALDDKLVVTHNYITKKGIAGIPELMTTDFLVGFFGKQKNLLEGGRYRPLSLVTFAIEWELFGPKVGQAQSWKNKKGEIETGVVQKITKTDIYIKLDGQNVVKKFGLERYLIDNTFLPFFSHFVNVLLYALTGVIIYVILLNVFKNYVSSETWYFSLAFVATMIWVAHPLHTEVVANIKGRDEILGMLLAIGTIHYALRYYDTKQPIKLLWMSLAFILGIMAKENAATFLFIAPLTLYYFKDAKLKDLAKPIGALVVTMVVYVIIRLAVIGGTKPNPIPELMNNPFLHAKPAEKFATIFYTMGLYIKLLFFPHPLTHDYYPWHPIAEFFFGQGPYPYLKWSDWRALLSLFAYLFLGYVALKGLKTKSIVAYGVTFYLTTFFIVSNLVFAVGTFMNERFMYMPSLGYALVVAYFLVEYLPKKIENKKLAKTISLSVFAVMIAGYSYKTIARSKVWVNDYTLSTTDVNVSYRSAKSNMSAGLAYVDKAKTLSTLEEKKPYIDKAKYHLKKSLKIYPRYIQPTLILGNAYYEVQEYDSAIYYFERCLKLNPQYEYAVSNLVHVGDLMTKQKKYKKAVKAYEVLAKYNKDKRVFAYIKAGEIYGRFLRNPKKAQEYLEKAVQLEPGNLEAVQKLGVVYAMRGEFQKSLKLFIKANELQPNNANILMNIGITYRNMGNEAEAQKYLQKAYQLNPKLKQKPIPPPPGNKNKRQPKK